MHLGEVKQPEIFEGPYTGMGAESGGVVGMLEVIQSDFERLETETEAAATEAPAVGDDNDDNNNNDNEYYSDLGND